MPRWVPRAVLVLMVALAAAPAHAHPAPFSYLDVHVESASLSGRLVLHTIDVAHELRLPDPAVLADPTTVLAHLDAIVTLMTTRVAIEIDGAPVTWTIDAVRPAAEQDAIVITWRCATTGPPAHLGIGAALFPYDPLHQTFVTVSEQGAVRWQEVLSRDRLRSEYFTGTRQGRLAVAQRFVASGIHHIAIGPDHILFILALLLPGGSVGRLLGIVTAFTVGHSVTLALATLSILDPPSHIVEPLIALSIVFVGADNLLVGRGARDVRVWAALAFGLIHGFGFAGVLRDTGLPSEALAVSLFAFNVGVEIGQAVIVVVAATILDQLRRRQARAAQVVVTVGSWVVVLAGVWWFCERVFLTPA